MNWELISYLIVGATIAPVLLGISWNLMSNVATRARGIGGMNRTHVLWGVGGAIASLLFLIILLWPKTFLEWIFSSEMLTILLMAAGFALVATVTKHKKASLAVAGGLLILLAPAVQVVTQEINETVKNPSRLESLVPDFDDPTPRFQVRLEPNTVQRSRYQQLSEDYFRSCGIGKLPRIELASDVDEIILWVTDFEGTRLNGDRSFDPGDVMVYSRLTFEGPTVPGDIPGAYQKGYVGVGTLGLTRVPMISDTDPCGG